MRRKQLYIDEELDDALKRVAAETGRSEADHVREALRLYLPAAVPPIVGDDPLLAFVGVIEDDDAPSDLASELDHYAYGVAKGHKRTATR
ncbi:MAG TPA: CopG family transcriptional regulator [Acidimicrobiales bacterium]|nr:CopG family transcriptional regulator [Acidimicrobiales bacterium]